ncbi:MAG TPA: hypothetical protein VKV04_03640, partial [Verrucomicrobiae bacterium]|nr:hypothetical protein [Verrucomicrobiae bacterium]
MSKAPFHSRRFLSPILLVLFVLSLGMLWSQSLPTQPAGYYDRKTAVQTPDSRAEKEAESLVSLSPETIISILRRETGLLLEVKKAVVRKA